MQICKMLGRRTHIFRDQTDQAFNLTGKIIAEPRNDTQHLVVYISHGLHPNYFRLQLVIGYQYGIN
tara:strand:- start:131895 stop:132092 length:198 start_codon:yes stop_codon:yes gene_type:complete